jgi:hypothetical protein
MMGKTEGSNMDSRTMMRDKSEDNSEGGKCYLYGLAMSHYSINCSNVFAKIDIPRPLKFVYQHLLRPRFVVLIPSTPMQPLFPRWYNPDKRCEYHGGVLGHSFQ